MPMPVKINPDDNQVLDSTLMLHDFRRLLREKAKDPAFTKAAEDGIKVVNCLCFIKVNEAFIRYAFTHTNDWSIYSQPGDKEKGVLRDYHNTSFHLNGYKDVEACIRDLMSSVDQFEKAIEIANIHDEIDNFIREMEYDDNVGCLAQRFIKPVVFAKRLETTTYPDLTPLLKEVSSKLKGQDESDDYQIMFDSLEPYYNKKFLYNNNEIIFTQDVVIKFMVEVLCYNAPTIKPNERTARQALELIKNMNALVKTFEFGPHNDVNIDFIINQLANPAKNRPVKLHFYQRTRVWNPKTGNDNHRQVKSQRPSPKPPGYKYTKKTSVSMLPSNAAMTTFHAHNNEAVGFLFDVNKVNLKDGKYIWAENAGTNERWWLGDRFGFYRKRSVTLDELRKQISRQVSQARIAPNNEQLVGLSVASLSAIFAHKNDVNVRVNALRAQIRVKEKLGIDLPVLIITPGQIPTEYDDVQQLKDVNSIPYGDKSLDEIKKHIYSKSFLNKDVSQLTQDQKNFALAFSILEKDSKTALKMIEANADADYEYNGTSVLVLAAADNLLTDVALALLKKGKTFSEAQISTTFRRFNPEIQKLILEKFPNKIDRISKNAGLVDSVVRKNSQLAIALLKCGADSELALRDAILGNLDAVVDHMLTMTLSDKAIEIALYNAVERGNVGLVEKLLKKGGDVVFCKIEGDTSLDFAIKKGVIDVARCILDYPTIKFSPKQLGKAIQLCVEHRHYDFIHFIQEKLTFCVNQIKLNESLRLAVRGADAKKVKTLLKEGADMVYMDAEGKSAIDHAVDGVLCRIIAERYWPIIEEFLHRGRDKISNENVTRLFNEAAISDDSDTRKYADYLLENASSKISPSDALLTLIREKPSELGLMKKIIKINRTFLNQATVGNNINSLLLEAVSVKNIDLVILLCENGADAANCEKGISPLALAMRDLNFEIVVAFLKHNQHPFTNDQVTYIFNIASKVNHSTCIDILLDKFFTQIDQGAKDAALNNAIKFKNNQLAIKLLERGASPSYNNVFWQAKQTGLDDVVKKIESYAALLPAIYQRALFGIVEDNRLDLVPEFCQKGADAAKNNGKGVSPLGLAINNLNFEMVVAFLKHNQQPFSNQQVTSAFSSAINKNQATCVDILLDKFSTQIDQGAKDIALDDAIKAKNNQLAIKLLEKGANGEGSLWRAIKLDLDDVVAKTLEKNTLDLNSANSISTGNYALHEAVEKGDISLIILLCKKNASPAITNDNGLSPLDLAIIGGNVDIVEALLTHSTYTTNRQLTNAFIMAIKHNKPKCVALLIDKFATRINDNAKAEALMAYVGLNNNLEMLKTLLVNKPDLLTGVQLTVAFKRAIETKDKHCISLLLSKFPDKISLTNEEWMKVFEYLINYAGREYIPLVLNKLRIDISTTELTWKKFEFVLDRLNKKDSLYAAGVIDCLVSKMKCDDEARDLIKKSAQAGCRYLKEVKGIFHGSHGINATKSLLKHLLFEDIKNKNDVINEVTDYIKGNRHYGTWYGGGSGSDKCSRIAYFYDAGICNNVLDIHKKVKGSVSSSRFFKPADIKFSSLTTDERRNVTKIMKSIA